MCCKVMGSVGLKTGPVVSTLTGDPHAVLALRDHLVFPDSDGEYHSVIGEDGSFHTGLLYLIKSTAQDLGVDVASEGDDDDDETDFGSLPQPIEKDILYFEDGSKLRDYQIRAVEKMLAVGRGLITIPTGSGKTEIAAAFLKYGYETGKFTKSLFLCDTTAQRTQTASRFKTRGLESVGEVGGGKFQLHKDIIVANVKGIFSKLNDRNVLKVLESRDVIIVDEAHHLSSGMWTAVSNATPAAWRFGLTPFLRDDRKRVSYADMMVIGHTGPPLVVLSSEYLRKNGYLAEVYYSLRDYRAPMLTSWSWHTVYDTGIVYQLERNRLVVETAVDLWKRGRRVLIFVNRIEHGRNLLRLLADCKNDLSNVWFLSGGNTAHTCDHRGMTRSQWDYNTILSELRGEERFIIIGSSVMDEGVDFPFIDALILAGAGRKWRRHIQRYGRGLRPKKDNRLFLVDFVDHHHFWLKAQSQARKEVCESEGYFEVEYENLLEKADEGRENL